MYLLRLTLHLYDTRHRLIFRINRGSQNRRMECLECDAHLAGRVARLESLTMQRMFFVSAAVILCAVLGGALVLLYLCWVFISLEPAEETNEKED